MQADIDGDGNVNYEEFVAMLFSGVSRLVISFRQSKIILNFFVFVFAFHWSELARHHFQRIKRLFQPFGRSKNSDDVVRTELNFGKRKSVSEVFPHFLRNHTSSITLPIHLLIGLQMYMS